MKIRILTLLVCIFLPIAVWAGNGIISGVVVNAETGEPMSMAQVEIVGKGLGSITDLNGFFEIKNVPAGIHAVRATFMGFTKSQEVVTLLPDEKIELQFKLKSDIIAGEEVTVLSTRAVKRESPVSFTDIPKEDIAKNLGNVDIPLILNKTPSVYATESGGAAGDARINVRGFNQRNIAVMINGVPVNDMENGWLYWSNWDGLADAASSIQIQRGMGISNVSVASVGGTMNVITEAAAQSPCITYKQEVGDYNYKKSTLIANSGLINNKFAFSSVFSRKSGDGWVDKTWMDAYSYFVSMSLIPHPKHKFEISALGAPQQHGQRLDQQKIAVFDVDYALDHGVDTTGITGLYDLGIDYNPAWGAYPAGASLTEYYNGEIHTVPNQNFLNTKLNYYHKPQFSINWFWDYNDKLNFSNVLYSSIGIGGGTNTIGSMSIFPADQNGQVSLDDIYAYNTNNVNPTYSASLNQSRVAIRNNVNQHKWYGWLGTANFKYSRELKFTGGLDVRYYSARHWREIRNLLGGDYFIDTANLNNNYTANPQAAMQQEGDKVTKDNEAFTRWYGIFGTSEYKIDKLYSFFNVSVNNTGYKRYDYFLPEENGSPASVGWKDFLGFVVKTGANYNLTDQIGVYGNLGHLNKAPIFDGVYADGNEEYENVTNEKVYSVESGVSYKHPKKWLTADAGLYYTYWQDRTWSNKITLGGEDYYTLMNGIDASHKGIEMNVNSEVAKWCSIYAMMSLGNWEWIGNVETTFTPDDNPAQDTTLYVYMDGVKVGGAPQTTMALGTNLYPFNGAYFGIVLTYFANHFADFDPTTRTTPSAPGPWEVPAYSVVDLHFGYKIPATFSNAKLQLFGHIYNLFDEQYITDATDGTGHDAASATVFFGRPRTWNFGFSVDL